ncbi:MAG: hypothetical protein ACRD0K_15820 [Egibacteraceae bacterium]
MPGGLDRDDFTINCQAGTVTCPNQITVPISAKGNASFAPPLRRLPAASPAHDRQGGARPAHRRA